MRAELKVHINVHVAVADRYRVRSFGNGRTVLLYTKRGERAPHPIRGERRQIVEDLFPSLARAAFIYSPNYLSFKLTSFLSFTTLALNSNGPHAH